MRTQRVLIVEDDQLIAEDLRRHVTKLGYDVVGAADSGEDAVVVADALQPDLVLMDVRLSGPMDGLEAGRLIVASKGCVLIYLTANPVPDQMRYYAEKPFSTATLAAVIAAALDGHNST
jgi:DNA-binding response OmpR family regulator